MKKICNKCEEEFNTRSRNQIFCSKCRDTLICKIDGCDNRVKTPSYMLCSKHYMLQFRNKIEPGYETRICLNCGSEYKPAAPNQKYCNSECKYINKLRINQKYIEGHRKIFIKICEWCKEEFKTTRDFQKFCSKGCYNDHVKRKSKKYYNEVIKKKKGHLNRGQSYPQTFIFRLLKKEFPGLEWSYDDRSIIKNPKTNYPLELDIWCPDKKVAIEYDGEHHVSPKQYGINNFFYVQELDSIKNKECKKNNIKLLRIAYYDNWKDEKWIIKKVVELLNGDN